MKTRLIVLLAALAFPLFRFAEAAAPAPAAEAAVGPQLPPVRVDLPVLKVYSAADGEAIFRAYVVKWKDQEVVVTDTLAKTNYRVGDIITLLVMNQPFPRGAEPYRLLHFSVVPPMAKR